MRRLPYAGGGAPYQPFRVKSRWGSVFNTGQLPGHAFPCQSEGALGQTRTCVAQSGSDTSRSTISGIASNDNAPKTTTSINEVTDPTHSAARHLLVLVVGAAGEVTLYIERVSIIVEGW